MFRGRTDGHSAAVSAAAVRASTRTRLAPALASDVVTRSALLAAGADPWLLDREVRAGRWTRVFPGVAVTSAGPPSEDQLVRACLLAGGSEAAITGAAACRLHGLRDVPSTEPVDLLVPASRRFAVPPGVRLRRTTFGDDVRTTARGGVRVTEVDEAVVDTALRLQDLTAVRALVLAALADGRADPARLRVLLDRATRHGSAALRRTLVDAARGAASAPEAECVDLLLPVARRQRLELLVNADVVQGGRLLGRVDLLLGRRVGVEVDSLRHHGSGADLEATLRRHDRLTGSGLRLVHVTPWALRRRPEQLLARVVEALLAPIALASDTWVVPRTPAVIDGATDSLRATRRCR